MKPLDAIEAGATLKQVLNGIERGLILEALEKFKWNVAEVAIFFAITRQGLLRKIDLYKIKRSAPSLTGLQSRESVAAALSNLIAEKLLKAEGALYFFPAPPEALASQQTFFVWNKDTFQGEKTHESAYSPVDLLEPA